ncbi:hypothetical protein MAPG_09467 [Magnaporthiopsis poae ATCC 64411]|uniref:Uncharacterized protein n=1 Tax=Magnaporthiopsis poae (strain ATCC 64411 / 73-15) TaxID=644358 RepID=A0A0C4EA13_MAGP6|nr:hypothetical protein MAPG_09467 [Magnaporthiopsis poae ATCC 64411]
MSSRTNNAAQASRQPELTSEQAQQLLGLIQHHALPADLQAELGAFSRMHAKLASCVKPIVDFETRKRSV